MTSGVKNVIVQLRGGIRVCGSQFDTQGVAPNALPPEPLAGGRGATPIRAARPQPRKAGVQALMQLQAEAASLLRVYLAGTYSGRSFGSDRGRSRSTTNVDLSGGSPSLRHRHFPGVKAIFSTPS